MKKFTALSLCLILLLSLTACGNSGEAPAETKAETISVTRLKSETRSNGSSEMKLEYAYDENGVCTEIVSYLDGQEVHRAAPVCDEKGNFLTKTYSNFGATIVETYTYDKNGKVLTFVQADPEGNVFFQYEDVPHENAEFAKRTMTQYMTMEDGSKMEMVQIMECTFDDNGYMIRQDITMNGALAEYYEMTNDEQGRLVKQLGYSPDGTLLNSMEVTYDGNTRHMVAMSADGTILNEQTGIVDDAGNRLEAKVMMNGAVVNHQTFSYITIDVPAA